ncbi:DUF2018 family protein [Helicobacter trogontum]|uniref:DUF2018 family protein n=1 Tax=Helicobacter trogontum TaxID=50960 RepID=A0A4U8SAB9_9HELI|nr:DUF2018 family protein [Helicobacter trogontum]MDY5184399.1 DUF2018 family protein [Helicobacter trogontum]TLD82974.1 DUF2018 family protein [Helicobacter trogontum]
MWENPLDNMEVFEGNPIDKWKEVIFNASRTLAHKEIERLLEELALYEMAFEAEEKPVNLREFFYNIHHDAEFKQQFLEKKNSLAIESMAKILSENE